jgi:hypothetical protein
MSDIVHLSVAQVFSKRAGLIQRDIEAMGLGVAKPIFVKRRIIDGEKRVKEYPLMPGYLFFETTADWGDISNVEGVIRVLSNGQRLTDTERWRLTLSPMMGDYDSLETSYAPPNVVEEAVSSSRRKPRRSNKIKRPGPLLRAKMRAERDCA